MNCRKVKKLLSPYLDNQLSKKEQRLVNEHLNICSKCQQELRGLRNLVTALKKMDSYPAPKEIMAKVDHYIHKEKAAKRSILFRPLFASASPLFNYLALAFFIGLVALSVSYLYYQIQPFQKAEAPKKLTTIDTEEAEDKAISTKAAPTKIQKRDKRKAMEDLPQTITKSKPPQVLKEAETKSAETPQPLTKKQKYFAKAKGRESLKKEHIEEGLKEPAISIHIKDKKDMVAESKPQIKATVRTKVASVEKEKAPPAEKEDEPKKRIQMIKAEEKTLDEKYAADFERRAEKPSVPGSLENPILIDADPLLDIEERVEPVLPEAEIKELREKTIVLELLVDAQGKVRDIKILKSSGKTKIDESIMSSVKQWKFKPFKYNDKPVAIKGKLTFKINKP
jgi:TonB family protein